MLLGAMMLAMTASAQKKWTMQDCIDYAMENNITLQKSKLQKQSATEDLKGSKGALLPTVNASTNQSLGYQPWKDAGVATVTNGTVNTKVDKSYYNGSYAVNAQWTVWNGGRNTNTIKLNQIAEDEAELQTKETANSILTAGGWYRYHEHHVGIGDRAYQGDWIAYGRRCHGAGHLAAVPDRECVDIRYGRPDRRVSGRGSQHVCRVVRIPLECARMEHLRIVPGMCVHRCAVWLHPRTESCKYGSNRSYQT